MAWNQLLALRPWVPGGSAPAPAPTPTPTPTPYTCTEPLIEVWPPPADAYNLRIRAYAQTAAFAADTDVTSVDSRLVFLLALANAKAHYDQADARVYLDQFSLRLRGMRARAHNDRRYRRNEPPPPPPRPKIV